MLPFPLLFGLFKKPSLFDVLLASLTSTSVGDASLCPTRSQARDWGNSLAPMAIGHVHFRRCAIASAKASRENFVNNKQTFFTRQMVNLGSSGGSRMVRGALWTHQDGRTRQETRDTRKRTTTGVGARVWRAFANITGIARRHLSFQQHDLCSCEAQAKRVAAKTNGRRTHIWTERSSRERRSRRRKQCLTGEQE